MMVHWCGHATRPVWRKNGQLIYICLCIGLPAQGCHEWGLAERSLAATVQAHGAQELGASDEVVQLKIGEVGTNKVTGQDGVKHAVHRCVEALVPAAELARWDRGQGSKHSLGHRAIAPLGEDAKQLQASSHSAAASCVAEARVDREPRRTAAAATKQRAPGPSSCRALSPGWKKPACPGCGTSSSDTRAIRKPICTNSVRRAA